MMVKNAVKRLAKHGEVKRTEGGEYYTLIGSHVVSFLPNGGYGDQEGDRSICCKGVRRVTDHSDIQSDYDANTYFDSLTQAIDFAHRMNQRP